MHCRVCGRKQTCVGLCVSRTKTAPSSAQTTTGPASRTCGLTTPATQWTRPSCRHEATKPSSSLACTCRVKRLRVQSALADRDPRGVIPCVLRRNLGPIRDDVVPKVTYTLTQAPLGIPDEALAAYGHVEFTAVGCRVANLHSEIRCLSFPGFASRCVTAARATRCV